MSLILNQCHKLIRYDINNWLQIKEYYDLKFKTSLLSLLYDFELITLCQKLFVLVRTIRKQIYIQDVFFIDCVWYTWSPRLFPVSTLLTKDQVLQYITYCHIRINFRLEASLVIILDQERVIIWKNTIRFLVRLLKYYGLYTIQ